MYKELLEKIGLSASEAAVYELLLAKGKSKASDLVPESGLGRGNVYNVLTSLVAKRLVLEVEGKQRLYQISDPSQLSRLIDEQKRKTERLVEEFANELPKLASVHQLTTGKPSIQIFEGLDGVEKALYDSLSASGEILTYLDPSAMVGELAELNKRYVAKRRSLGIQKRIILPNNPAAHHYVDTMSGSFTDIKLASNFADNFKTAMETYNNRVSFLTLTPEKLISVIIDDVNIANLQKTQFEFIWHQL